MYQQLFLLPTAVLVVPIIMKCVRSICVNMLLALVLTALFVLASAADEVTIILFVKFKTKSKMFQNILTFHYKTTETKICRKKILNSSFNVVCV